MVPGRFRQLEERAVEAGGAEPTKESAMRYMLMIHNDPELHPTPGSPEWDQLMADYGEFSKQLVERGHTFSGDPLNDPSTATTVRVRDGETLTVDGPFAETKEWMSGYYIVDFESLDQALRCAAMIPSAKFGSVEVRPVAEM
jgi:hypothetical protein